MQSHEQLEDEEKQQLIAHKENLEKMYEEAYKSVSEYALQAFSLNAEVTAFDLEE